MIIVQFFFYEVQVFDTLCQSH